MYYTLHCAYFQLFTASRTPAHIIPVKVRLAVALKEEAEWQVFVRDCEHRILLLYSILLLFWAYTYKRFRLIIFGGANPVEILG